MKFSEAALVTFLATVAGVDAFVAPALSSNVAFITKSPSSSISNQQQHSATCACPTCTGRTVCQLTRGINSCTCPACMGSATHPASCLCSACTVGAHPAGCVCGACRMSSMLLRMAEEGEAEAAADDVPPEVEAVEGTLSEDEVHNKERPARGSGLKKHSKTPKGTPLSEIEVGSTLKGTIKTITSYGAFMDIGAQSDALLHVSRMSDDFTSNPEDVVSVGQEVDVRVFSVDTTKNQIAVTMQSVEAETKAAEAKNSPRGGGGRRKERPQRSGGDRAAQRTAMSALASQGYDEDQFVEGEVVNTLDFGAFVRVDISQLGEGLEGEIDGLVHVSCLMEGRADSVDSVVKTGQKVQVRVKMLDAEGGKVGLSMITKEAEAKSGGGGRGGGGGEGGQQRRERAPRNAMFRPDEMGASDWKESLEASLEVQPEFKNLPIIEKKSKQLA